MEGRKTIYLLFLWCIPVVLCPRAVHGQAQDRIEILNKEFQALAISIPDLNQEINLSVSGIPVQEFLRALAEAAALNIHVSETLDQTISNNFQQETAANILLFLASEYNLDYTIVGSIISVKELNERDSISPIERRIRYNKELQLLSLELKNDSLQRIAKLITQISGRNVIVANPLRDSLITLYVESMTLKNALSLLVFNNRMKLTETIDSSFVLLPLAPGEVNYLHDGASPGIRRITQVEGQEQALQIAMDDNPQDGKRRITVDATNVPIVEIIKSAAEQTGDNYFIYDGIVGAVSARIKEVGFAELLEALLKGTEYTYRLNQGIYTIGNRDLEGLRQIKVIPLQHRSLDTIQAMIPTEWKKGIEITEFREQNALLVAGAAPQVKEVSLLISQLDKRVPMILIEVNMIDIRKGNDIKTGISMGVSDSISTGGTLFSGLDYTFGAQEINKFLSAISTGGAFNLGRVAPNFYVQLSALEQNNNVEIRSVPKLSTLNGHAASLSIGNSRYFSVSTQNVMGTMNPQTVVTESFTKVDAAMIIDIHPVVSGDEQVTMMIKIDISDFTQDTPINQPPPSTTSKFESIIRIKNEETVVLGGIERFESAQGGKGIPLLSRIPGLKWLFSSRTKSQNKVVSVVFIKPTIIYH